MKWSKHRKTEVLIHSPLNCQPLNHLSGAEGWYLPSAPEQPTLTLLSAYILDKKSQTTLFSIWIIYDKKRLTYSYFHLQMAPIRMALSFSSISQPRLHQFQLSLWPSCRGGPEDSKTLPTCKVWIILSQVMALPKKQCFEIIEDLLVFWTNLSIKIIFAIFNFL